MRKGVWGNHGKVPIKITMACLLLLHSPPVRAQKIVGETIIQKRKTSRNDDGWQPHLKPGKSAPVSTTVLQKKKSTELEFGLAEERGEDTVQEGEVWFSATTQGKTTYKSGHRNEAWQSGRA